MFQVGMVAYGFLGEVQLTTNLIEEGILSRTMGRGKIRFSGQDAKSGRFIPQGSIGLRDHTGAAIPISTLEPKVVDAETIHLRYLI